MDVVNKMIAWESGELDHDETVEFFQHLIDTGMVFSLQGCYQRTAAALIRSGDCRG